MGKRLYADIEIRGRVFATAADAAAHFGVTAQTVRIAVRSGTTHRIGTGAVGPEPGPVRIRGVVYPTAAAAAAALGLTANAIRNAVCENRTETVGLPRCHLRKPGAKEITLAGVRFASLADAERALGLSRGYISHAIQRNRAAARERILAAAMAYAAKAARRAA